MVSAVRKINRHMRALEQSGILLQKNLSTENAKNGDANLPVPACEQRSTPAIVQKSKVSEISPVLQDVSVKEAVMQNKSGIINVASKDSIGMFSVGNSRMMLKVGKRKPRNLIFRPKGDGIPDLMLSTSLDG